jgi:hypothetical protein
VKIHITEKDLQSSCVTALNNPISSALRRETGTLWYAFDGTTIRRTASPLEPIRLPSKMARWWQSYKDLQAAYPIEFEVDIDNTKFL